MDEARLHAILDAMRGVRVVVLGDVMLDVYLSGRVSRISPEAPVPVVQVTEERVAVGGAANVAANVAALGAECDLLGVVGNDADAERLLGALWSFGAGLRPHLLRRADRRTTTKTRVMARSHQIVRFDREEDHDLPVEAAHLLVGQLEALLDGADALVLEDYDKGVLGSVTVPAALRSAAKRGVPTVVDPKFRNFFAYNGATVFKPNVLELSAALGVAAETAWSADALEAARRRLGCEHLLLTLGEDGIALQSAKAAPVRVPARARQVYDVSGAGDTVTACVAAGLGAGATLREAAELANLAAGVEVGKPGVAVVSPAEILDAFRDQASESPFHHLAPTL